MLNLIPEPNYTFQPLTYDCVKSIWKILAYSRLRSIDSTEFVQRLLLVPSDLNKLQRTIDFYESAGIGNKGEYPDLKSEEGDVHVVDEAHGVGWQVIKSEYFRCTDSWIRLRSSGLRVYSKSMFGEWKPVSFESPLFSEIMLKVR